MHRIALTLLAMPPMLVACLFAVGRIASTERLDMHFSAAIALVLFYSLFVYASVVLVAVPLLCILLWRGWPSLLPSVLVGMATSIVIPSIPALSTLSDSRLHLSFRLAQFLELWPFLACGAFAGAAFWLVALRKNPFAHSWSQSRRSRAAESAA